MLAESTMTPEMRRRWTGIRSELGRLEQFDRNVYAEVVSLLARINLLEADNEDLRAELADRHRFEGKE